MWCHLALLGPFAVIGPLVVFGPLAMLGPLTVLGPLVVLGPLALLGSLAAIGLLAVVGSLEKFLCDWLKHLPCYGFSTEDIYNSSQILWSSEERRIQVSILS